MPGRRTGRRHAVQRAGDGLRQADDRALESPHGVAGQLLLVGWLQGRGWSRREVQQFSVVVGGHHGVPPATWTFGRRPRSRRCCTGPPGPRAGGRCRASSSTGPRPPAGSAGACPPGSRPSCPSPARCC
ncbi:HD domain-containing protein [Nocardiopsis composta]